MHAIIFAVAATTESMELNGQVAEIIASKGILHESANSYNQMILVGTKADRVEHGQVSLDQFRKNIGREFYSEKDRGDRKICFTRGEGGKDPATGQHADIDTKELERILKDMPFEEIVFKEFSEECLNAMLEKLTHLNPEEIREQLEAHKRALDTIKELEDKLKWNMKDGKEAFPEKRDELEGTIRRLENESRLTSKQKKELEKAENEYQVIRILEGLHPKGCKRPRVRDLVAFIDKKMPGQTSVYKALKRNYQWQIFQWAQLKQDYELKDLKRTGADRLGRPPNPKKRGRTKETSTTPRKRR